MNKQDFMDHVRGKLIVSCQALPEEPLYSPYIMGRMAYAAMMGGAAGIRANSVADILEIKRLVDLPLIGINKHVYEGSQVYITPTLEDVEIIVKAGADVIATDATNRLRPYGLTLDEFYCQVRAKYPDLLLMADCSTYSEGVHAAQLGFDFIGTTMSGYTEASQGAVLPNISLMSRLVRDLQTPVIGEGGIWNPEELQAAMKTGILTCVVGSAITRPMLITRRFVQALDPGERE
jgi:N-acylglucosamine-6-phosphate 2-epimerase